MSSNDSKKFPKGRRHGLIIVNTGNGKGKTTAALGTAFRAVGVGFKVKMIQFIKGSWDYGELHSAAKLGFEMASEGCENLQSLAYKRRQQVAMVWRDICRKSGQGICTIPAEALKM